MKTYCGAGILFFFRGPKGIELLLGQRNSGVWSIPGGRMSVRDRHGFFACAKRETAEEFGVSEIVDQVLMAHPRVRYCVCFPLIVFNWVTYLVELPDYGADFPSPDARDYWQEFRGHGWFLLSSLPSRLHFLLWPAILWLRFLNAGWSCLNASKKY